MAALKLLVLCLPNAAAVSSWPMFRRSPLHDAAVAGQGPRTNATAWIVDVGAPIYSSPVLGGGVVYVTTYATPKGSLVALDEKSGAISWSFVASGPIGSTPYLIEELGLVVFGSDDGFLYAVDLSGKEVWRYRHSFLKSFSLSSAPLFVSSSPTAGTLYFGTSDSAGNIYALAVEGKQKPTLLWSHPTGSSSVPAGVPGSCAFVAGALFVGANDGKVYSLDASTGKLRWSMQTMSIVYSSPAFGQDTSRLFVGSNDGSLYAFNQSTGTQLWSLSTPGWVDSSPAVAAGGTVYATTSNGNGIQNYAAIYAVNGNTGEVIWQNVLADADGLYDPVVVGNIVYAGSVSADASSSGGAFQAWDSATGNLLWKMDTAGHLGAAAAVGEDGSVFVGDRMGKLYKFAITAVSSELIV